MKTLLFVFTALIPSILGQDACLKWGKLGKCILLADCPRLRPMVVNLSIEQFLVLYGCGRGKDGNVRVCCPTAETDLSDLVTKVVLPNTSTTTITTTLAPLPKVTSADRTAGTGDECSAPFQLFEQECILLHDSFSVWKVARQICQSFGADLYVAPNKEHFQRMRKYIIDSGKREHYWVGIKERKWLSSRDVDPQEWRISEPNGSYEECGFMGNNGAADSYFLYDFPCNGENLALCQKKLG